MTRGYYRVMVSGHRSLPHGSIPWVQEQLAAVVSQLNERYGMRRALTGMALGVDQMFARTALAQGVRVEAYIPGRDQSTRWSADQIAEYELLMARTTAITSATSEMPYASYISRLHKRNEMMIRDCNLAILVLDDRQSGGTHVVKMKLAAAKKPTIHIDPKNRTATASWALQA
jgi:uncharacterized phage-like protein YoqJ